MDIGSLIVVGVIVSLLVQWLKKVLGVSDLSNGDVKDMLAMAIVLVVSLVAGLIYQLFNAAPWWQGAYDSLVYAGAVYAFIILRFKK